MIEGRQHEQIMTMMIDMGNNDNIYRCNKYCSKSNSDNSSNSNNSSSSSSSKESDNDNLRREQRGQNN